MKQTKNVRWKFFLFKTKLLLAWINYKNYIKRTKYCHKGYHKLFHGYLGQSTDGKWKKVHYLKCRHCNYMFFASESHMKMYLDMTAKERSAFRDLLSRMKLKHHNNGGRKSKKEASASS